MSQENVTSPAPAGSPAASPAPKSPAPGSPAAGSPGAASPAAGSSPAGSPAGGSPAPGSPTVGSPTAASPSAASPSAASPGGGEQTTISVSPNPTGGSKEPSRETTPAVSNPPSSIRPSRDASPGIEDIEDVGESAHDEVGAEGGDDMSGPEGVDEGSTREPTPATGSVSPEEREATPERERTPDEQPTSVTPAEIEKDTSYVSQEDSGCMCCGRKNRKVGSTEMMD